MPTVTEDQSPEDLPPAESPRPKKVRIEPLIPALGVQFIVLIPLFVGIFFLIRYLLK